MDKKLTKTNTKKKTNTYLPRSHKHPRRRDLARRPLQRRASCRRRRRPPPPLLALLRQRPGFRKLCRRPFQPRDGRHACWVAREAFFEMKQIAGGERERERERLASTMDTQ